MRREVMALQVVVLREAHRQQELSGWVPLRKGVVALGVV